MQTIKTKGLTAGSLYKLLFIGLFVPLFIFGLACGIGSFFGASLVSLNGVQVYGLKGLLTGAGLGVALPLIMTTFLWILMVVGLFIWTRFVHISLTIKQ